MFHRVTKKWLSFLLAVLMIVSVVPYRASAASTNYADFMEDLKKLEVYAQEYADAVKRDAGELVLNFIRTGVERYQDDNWTTLAGQEIVGFTNYVQAQDTKLGTSVMDLRDIETKNFFLPNGNRVDFGHMFGCMNISYVAQGSADLSGWAGDLCDLLQYSAANIDDINANTDGSVESMAAYVREHCFGIDASGAFGWDDFYGDMDAYYLVSEYKKGAGSFSELMDAYFTADLNDVDRSVYFMNNRFAVEDSQAAVRKAIYESYSSNTGIKLLEASRGLSIYNALREACCYAFADYVYSQAKGQLVAGSGDDEVIANGYYSVFSNEHSILAPGIAQDINYAQTADGKQIVYYVATVDVTRDDVDILVNYKDNKAPVGNDIGLQRVEDQTAALVKNYQSMKDENGDPLYENFNAVVATNGAGYNITNGIPAGLVVMNGVEYSPVGAPGFFAILKDGTALIGTQEDYAARKDEIKEGIQAFGSVLVKDGKVCVTKSANYTSNRASRTAIGITATGEVVMMVLDGRQLPRSAGGAMEEIAQIMLEAGCVEAVNLDGGGSTTYLSKPAGSDEIQLVNTPSDGYARSVSTSLVAVSTAKPTTDFDHAIISSDYEYITAGTSMQFSVTGVSNTGNAADIPAGSYWTVSDESIATIDEDGVFTALDYGEVTVQYIVNGEVAGSKVINVVIPDNIKFAEDRITAIYGQPKDILLTLWYEGNPVAFNAQTDIIIGFLGSDGQQIEAPGTIEGVTFTPDEDCNLRTIRVVGVLLTNTEVGAVATINMYRPDEATFDFENATQGNRMLAWNREIENAKTTDNQLYRISDPKSPVEIDYTFALDMTTIDMPAQLEPIKGMLPTAHEGATAWTYLLQLAERVCVQTKVVITAEFSKELELDISGLKVVNDYFNLTSVNLDANNVLTIVCNWRNQSQPINEATANPLCILSGIKATLKGTAAYYNDEVLIANNGTVAYDIYLAASSLHSFAQDPGNQADYGLYPYIHEEDCRSEFSDAEGDEVGAANNDKGAHFSSQYIDFADIFVVNTEIRKGWHEEDGDYYYYVDNVPVTGTQMVTDRKDATKNRIYEFDKTGKLIDEQGFTGLVEIEDNLYYPAAGIARTGWWEIDGKFYYFHPDTGAAVDGKFTIRENKNSWQTADFEYTFEDHILVKGAWLNDSQSNLSGWRYRWAGDWIVGEWFQVDGKWYFSNKNEYGYVRTGYQHYIPAMEDTTVTKCYLFDDRGALMEDFNGAKFIEGRNEYRYFVAGRLYSTIGIAQGDDGYYYHVTGTGIVTTSGTADVNEAQGHGFVPAGTYTFDNKGRMTEKFVTVDDDNIKSEDYSVEVMGRAVTVTNDTACKAFYEKDGQWIELDAIDNGDGSSYNFAAPKGVNNVTVVLSGDANGDGKAATSDISRINAFVQGKNVQLTGLALLVADVNGDGRITASDMARLHAMIKGKTRGW